MKHLLPKVVLILALCYGGEVRATVSEVDTITVLNDGDNTAWLGDYTKVSAIPFNDAILVQTGSNNTREDFQVDFNWLAMDLHDLDSIKVLLRLRYTGFGSPSPITIRIHLDTNGTDILDLDTAIVTFGSSFNWFTTRAFTNTDWFSKEVGRSPDLEIGIHTGTAPAFRTFAGCSTAYLIVYHTRPDGFFYVSDTAEISSASNFQSANPDFSAVWSNFNSADPAIGNVSSVANYRLPIGIDSNVVQDGVSTDNVDSAFVKMMIRDTVGTPTAFSGYIVTRDADGGAIYRANTNAAGYCHSEYAWRKHHGGTATDCADSVLWNTAGLVSPEDHLAGALFAQSAVANGQISIDVTAWIDSVATGDETGGGNGIILRTDTEKTSGNHYYRIIGPYPGTRPGTTSWQVYNKQMYIAVYHSEAAAGGGIGRRRRLLTGSS